MSRGLRPLSVQLGMMMAASGESAGENLPAIISGLQKYQAHTYQRTLPPLNILWQSGSASIMALEKVEMGRRGRPVLLLVPSMVNKAYIFDLIEQRSLLRWLEGEGISVCLLDWGNPSLDPDMAYLNSVVTEKLVPAIRYVAHAAGAPVHVLGYCMGGTLLCGAVAHTKNELSSLTFLAAPWDFHAGAQHLAARVRTAAPAAVAAIRDRGCLPLEWTQSVFATIAPENAAQKFMRFASMDASSDAAKLFVAVEDWLNDGVNLPGGMAEQVIRDWFTGNLTGEGAWEIDARPVRPGDIDTPTLIMTSKNDRLVDYESAAALHTQVPGSRLIDTGLGHVGMIAGRNAVEQAWKPLRDWIKANS